MKSVLNVGLSGPAQPTGLLWESKYLGIDPGPDTGWASAQEHGHMTGQGQIILEDLPEFLEGMTHVELCVCEAYIPRARYRKAHYNKPVITAEAIGVVKSWARRYQIRLIMQDPAHLEIGSKMTGMPVPSGRAHGETHWIAAWNHLQYWMIRNGLAKSLLEMQNEEKHGG